MRAWRREHEYMASQTPKRDPDPNNEAVWEASMGSQEAAQDAGLRLRHAAALAATLNPYGVLARGYALVQDEKGRICAPDALREGQKMTLCGAVNRIHCTVDAVEGPNESTQEL